MTTDEKRNAKGLDELEGGLGKHVVINGATLENIIIGTQTATIAKSETKKIQIKKSRYVEMQKQAFTQSEEDAIRQSQKLVSDYFNFQLTEIVKNFKGIADTGAMIPAVTAVVSQTSKDLQDVFNMIYKDVAFDHVVEARKSYKLDMRRAIGLNGKDHIEGQFHPEFSLLADFKEEFGSFVDNYFVQINLGELIKDIDETTRDMVGKIVIAGSKEGASVFDITRDIQKLYGDDMELWRAERIARTETLRGMSFAQHEAQKSISPLSKQEWIDSGDNRVRAGKFNHRNVDIGNGKIGLNDAFSVSGQKMRFPRDTSLGASAGNVINCRCTVGFIDEEFEEFFL